jgi:hypothetical protein
VWSDDSCCYQPQTYRRSHDTRHLHTSTLDTNGFYCMKHREKTRASRNTTKPRRQILDSQLKVSIESPVKDQWKFHRNRPPEWVIPRSNAQRSTLNAQRPKGVSAQRSKLKCARESEWRFVKVEASTRNTPCTFVRYIPSKSRCEVYTGMLLTRTLFVPCVRVIK